MEGGRWKSSEFLAVIRHWLRISLQDMCISVVLRQPRVDPAGYLSCVSDQLLFWAVTLQQQVGGRIFIVSICDAHAPGLRACTRRPGSLICVMHI